MRAYADDRYERMKGAKFYQRLDFALYILMVLVIALGVRAFLFEPVRVDGDSMIPTLVHNEDMLVEKMTYWFSDPQRGDIVICFYPGYTESCVKRVIGLPGETVAVKDGVITINGEPIDESPYWKGEIIGDVDPVTVGAREVFVVGDNRNGSKDSRNASVGCIPFHKVVGRVRAVIWPLAQWRAIEGASYAG